MIAWTCTGWQRGPWGEVHIMHQADFFLGHHTWLKKKISYHITSIFYCNKKISLNPMIFTNHGSPEEKSHITHYENSNHASFSLFGMDPIKYDADNLGWAVIKCHGKLLMPPSLCFTQNQLNYVQMTSFSGFSIDF